MNAVFEKLAPSKRIQIRKDIKDPEARELYKKAKEAKSRAVISKDPEDQRQVRNLTAVTARICHKAEVDEIKANLANPRRKWKQFGLEKLEDNFPTVIVDK